MIEANTEYVLHYRHDGQIWAMHFFAVDDADAELKVVSVRASLELKGRLIGAGASLEEAARQAAQTESTDLLRRLVG